MATKINTVLLIDDDLTINYYHNRLIEKSALTDYILITKNGAEGLASFLELNNTLTNDDVVLLFLDLNMPIMNGWEFLETLSKSRDDIKINYKIYILSSTINPEDKNKAKKNSMVTGFISKPLTRENLELLRAEYAE